MSKVLKIIVNIFMVLAILIAAAILVPPLLGVTTTIVDTENMGTNLPMGSVTYSKDINVMDLKEGDKILKESESSTYAYIVESGDAATGQFVVKNAADQSGESETITLRNNVSRVALTIPLIGYVMVAMHSTEGIIILVLIVVFMVILFILSELWKKKDDDEYEDEEDDEADKSEDPKARKRREKAERKAEKQKAKAERRRLEEEDEYDDDDDYYEDDDEEDVIQNGQEEVHNPVPSVDVEPVSIPDIASEPEKQDETDDDFARSISEAFVQSEEEAAPQVDFDDVTPENIFNDEKPDETPETDEVTEEEPAVQEENPEDAFRAEDIAAAAAETIIIEETAEEIIEDSAEAVEEEVSETPSEEFEEVVEAPDEAVEEEIIEAPDEAVEEEIIEAPAEDVEEEIIEAPAEAVEEEISEEASDIYEETPFEMPVISEDVLPDSQEDIKARTELDESSAEAVTEYFQEEEIEDLPDPDASEFVPVHRLTLSELMEQAEKNGENPKIIKDVTTGVTLLDYSDLI